MPRYDKLVRDRIPDIIAEKGERSTVHVASDEEYRSKLREKLTEEVAEFMESGEREELADVLEVVYALAAERGLSQEELERIRREKAEKRGGFAGRIILEETS